MANQNKASPSDEFQLFGVLISIVPVLGAAVLAACGGFFLGRWVPSGIRPYLIIIAWSLLIGMFILDKDPTWNFFLLVGFSLLGGMLLQGLAIGVNQGKVWGSLAVGFMIALLWGSWSGSQLSQAGMYLFPITVLYLMGWIGVSFFTFPTQIVALWAGLGWLLFTLIGTSVFSRGASGVEKLELTALASDLFVVFFNLFWLGIIFWESV